MPSSFSMLWDFQLLEKMILRLVFCLQQLCSLLLDPFRYYLFFIFYYSLISVENLKWYEIPGYSLSKFLRSWLGEGAGELLPRWDSTLEVGLKRSCWPGVLGAGAVGRLSLCWICAIAAGESSSCWSCVLGGTAEEMMPWGAAVELLLREFITKLEILTLNMQLLLFLVFEQWSFFISRLTNFLQTYSLSFVLPQPYGSEMVPCLSRWIWLKISPLEL